MKKIIITGGSGFIGTNMQQYYLDQGHKILNIDLVRPLNKIHNSIWTKCDINNIDHLIEVFNNFQPTHVMHLAAGTGMNVSDIGHFRTNYDGVRNIIDACNEINSVQKVIFTSSLLVCERDYKPLHDEDYKPDCLYGESKVMSEKIVRSSDLNAKWSIVRPTAVWGPWFRSSYTTFFNLIKKGYYINPSMNRLQKPATFVGNTVYMMDKILSSESTSNDVYYLADYPEYSVQEWAEEIAKGFNRRSPYSFPESFVRGLAKIGDLLILLNLYNDPPLTTFRLNNIISGVKYDTEKTSSVVGTLPFSLKDGVRDTINWMNN